MSVEEHKRSSHAQIGFAILTVSDSRTKKNDGSGQLIFSLLEKNGHLCSAYLIVPDDRAKISSAIKKLLQRDDIEAIIVNGGTGISERDVTFEALDELYEKKLDGFGELFRMLSYSRIKSASIMSRASAGISKGKIIFSLPGSPSAVRLAMEKIILLETAHIIHEMSR
ncbi:MAG: MogA/MoaB family molybdenum cofactor biosynthesis protein [Acidobacteriota bacterium]